MNIKEFVKKINWKYVAIVVCVLILVVSLYLYNRQLRLVYYTSEEFNANNKESSVESNNVNKSQQSNGNNSKYVEPDAEIILYYTTWCGYSRMFLPEWEKFQNHVKQNIPNVKTTMMRCEGGDEATCSQKGVEGYPTVIMYLKDGQEIQFNEERSSKKLIEFTINNLQV